MSNEFMELVMNPLMQLDHTKRYSGTKLVEEETLSQHVVDTIMLGLLIIDRINYEEGKKVFDPSQYVMKAVYHDLEEIITGDVPRPLKYYNENTTQSLKSVADTIAYKLFNDNMHDSRSHYRLWSEAKSGNEGHILKIVDTLVVAYKVVKEVRFLHNGYMLRVASEVAEYLAEYQEDVRKLNNLSEISSTYLSKVIRDAIESMNAVIETNKRAIEDLKIPSTSLKG